MQPHPCLLCGQATVTPSMTPLSPTPASSTMEEITLITDQTRRIDEAISVLHVTRTKLLRRLNDLQSPTNSLAPEILSTIFTHVSDFGTPDFRARIHNKPEVHSQIMLSTVSSYWRQVVCSTPHLWATALMIVEPRTVARKAKLLQLYFRTVQDVPFSLYLSLRETNSNSPDFHPILQTLQEGAQKFIFLDLYTTPETWFPILSPHFRKLEGLRLEHSWSDDFRGDDSPQISHLLGVLSLRQVYLGSCLMGGALPNQPCHSITDLHLTFLSRTTCIQLLVSCPNLVSYRCESSYDDLDELPSDIVITTFQNMRFFQVPDSAATPFGELLSRLHFPVLETFGMELDDRIPWIEDLLAFFQSLPATCSAFEITGNFTAMMITQIIQAAPPQVRSLKLLTIGSSDLATLLQALCDNFNTDFLNMRSLRHIHITDWRGSSRVVGRKETIPQLFLDMVSARKEFLDGHFLLEIDSEPYDSRAWTGIQDRLRAFISDGFKLEIFVSGVLIPGLREIYD